MLKQNDKIGEYTLIEKIGSGGFGDVWKAEKRTIMDANFFALKFFRPKEDKVDLEKIRKEIEVWKKVRGLPHIISVIELDKFEDYIYVVSDFADGGSLENWLKSNGGKAESEEHAVKIAIEILTGLENLHEKGVIHRDLKPDNILIMNGKHCLADFGVSREVKSHSKATGTAGTMEYMPPEAFENKFSVQTDIWAIGVILQRLLTCELPFPQDNQAALIGAIVMFEAEKMPESVSPILREIVEKCLQKEPSKRFSSVSKLKDELQSYLKESKEKTEVFENNDAEIETEIIENKDVEVETVVNEIVTIEKESETISHEIETVVNKNSQHQTKTEAFENPILPTEDWKEIERKKDLEVEKQQDEIRKIQDSLVDNQDKPKPNYFVWAIVGTLGIILFVSGLVYIFTNSNVNKPNISSLSFGKNEKAEPQTTDFNLGEKVNAVASITNSMSKTKVHFSIFYENVAGRPKGQEAGKIDVEMPSSGTALFYCTPVEPGDYKVDATLIDESGKELDKKSGIVNVKVGSFSQKTGK